MREERDFVKASKLIKIEFTHYLNYERQTRMVNNYEQIKHKVNRAKLTRQSNEDKEKQVKGERERKREELNKFFKDQYDVFIEEKNLFEEEKRMEDKEKRQVEF
ncbi:hypothetical protein O9G_005492 [Rozella allomycis CSF55]|uniref:Uncharacterized protein n=1 Tax=Rozella allomycis (strain CSF55) TaxID=988480 RepID=A0A075AXV3_ROZAC|nr:hypothetical protein O9G_005492 [Rozella allomycis CSF55]|eukprot:EPZ35105.1 hypothetical protein O9G_005492 [Rozella allomycis CSF55]